MLQARTDVLPGAGLEQGSISHVPSTRDLLGPPTKAMSRRVGSFVGSLDMLGPTCAPCPPHPALPPACWPLSGGCRRLEYEPDSGSEAGGLTQFRSPMQGTILEGSQELDESWAL